MDKKKKGGPKVWSRQQERILQKWGEAAACYRYMHNQAFLTYKKSSMRFTIPVIVLSTVTGTANFAQSSFPPSMRSSAPALIGFLNLIAGLIATVMQFLKINELMEGHRVSSIQYGKLSRTIRLELSLPLEERNQDGKAVIEAARAEYDRLIEQSPSIPYEILMSFDKAFPSGKKYPFNRPEIMEVHPINTFISEEQFIQELNKDFRSIREDVYADDEEEEVEVEIESVREFDSDDESGKQA
jgi:hypothetical protein